MPTYKPKRYLIVNNKQNVLFLESDAV